MNKQVFKTCSNTICMMFILEYDLISAKVRGTDINQG